MVGEDLCDSLVMGSKRKERLQLVFCYRLWGETVEVGIGGPGGLKVSSQPICFPGRVVFRLSGCLLELQSEIKQ